MIFQRFKRIKTAFQHGVFLSKDPNDLFTCPLHVIAIALVMSPKPSRRIFPQFAGRVPEPLHDADEQVGLVELLSGLESTSSAQSACALPGAQAYVNRLLTSANKLSGVHDDGQSKGLTSHSFRRKSAMHPNADNRLSSLWVADRGGWNMSSVSKAFSYMLKPTQEDQQVSHQLSGWSPLAGAKLPDLRSLDGVVRARVNELQN